ncbi:hypothetical protein NW759_011753 [Fusarium solani]|nr:hypothetical protein NW759_011753 [Fusarium solani]
MAPQNVSASTSNGDLDSAPEVQEPLQDELRRARKRATDRKSQRQHRERQRTYIRQLEGTIETLKASLAQSNNGQVSTLLEEQERLRARCKQLEATILRIAGLASSVSEQKLDSKDADLESERYEGADGPCVPLTVQQTPPPDDIISTFAEQPQALCDPPLSSLDQGPHRTPCAAVLEIPDPVPTRELDFFDLSDCFPVASVDEVDLAQVDKAAADMPTLEADGRQDSMERCIASILDGTAVSLDVLPASIIRPSPLAAEQRAHTSSWNSLPVHLSMPKVSNDMGAWDSIIMKMVNEARLQYRCGLFPVEEPSLRNVLSAQSTDVLASRLYHHICSYGPMPLHLLLSIFWIQYVLLRWYVLGTRVDFLRIPEFMRPTDLERRIPHRPCIGMFAW